MRTFAGIAGTAGSADGIGSAARFSRPSGVATDLNGNVYVADTLSNTIRRITPDGTVTTLAGMAGVAGEADGLGAAARFHAPTGLATDTNGNVFVADSYNYSTGLEGDPGFHVNTIRKITPAGLVTTLAGSQSCGAVDGMGSAAQFCGSSGLATDRSGNVYVADSANNTIRKVTQSGAVTTVAGLAGAWGSVDGASSAARFGGPAAIAADGNGTLYVADAGNNTIREISQDGLVTTLAGLAAIEPGSNDGPLSVARFNVPTGVTTDSTGNIFVADAANRTIRKISPDGVVTTLAGVAANLGSVDGKGSAARFSIPNGVATDLFGNVYVADNTTIRKVAPDGQVTTLAGLADTYGSVDGIGLAARFSRLDGIATDRFGNVYVTDTDNDTIRRMTPDGLVATLAGLAGNSGSSDGIGSVARFYRPGGVATDNSGNVYVADSGNNTIRKITPDGLVTTLAGSPGVSCAGSNDGLGAAARFCGPYGLAIDSNGNIYVGDARNHEIRRIAPDGMVTTVAGTAEFSGDLNGSGPAARFFTPGGVAIDSLGNLYVADSYDSSIRKGIVYRVGRRRAVTP
ncbi:MAG TPA: NHL repeat-containing protein [Thermoanaerobaculia bacterium]